MSVSFPRAWSQPAPGYAPRHITPPELRPLALSMSGSPAWAEPAATPYNVTDWPARQAAALVPFTVLDGVPHNPAGRTGRSGRNLGRWGENTAADAVVYTATEQGRHLLLIRRGDTGQWALPGGMVEPGETSRAASMRELAEETGLFAEPLLHRPVFTGYVDDPRNSDHAWVCTSAWLYHVPAHEHDAPGLPWLAAADDAIEARWWRYANPAQLAADIERTGDRVYPAHRPVLDAVDGCPPAGVLPLVSPLADPGTDQAPGVRW